MSSKSRTAPTAPGTHSRPTGRKPKYVQYESFRPASREHAPDTADTAQDFDDTPYVFHGTVTAAAIRLWLRQ
ncbi:hypothetical protein [Streptomyces albidoflavus]|uniref:hypothetical protein n=1 Tax=Streptomyces albidoflavus TaxID=1886 RepID=UPI0033C4C821